METKHIELKDVLIANHKNFESYLADKTSSILIDRRKDAIINFGKLGFPSVKDEEWKYTNISTALKKDFTLDSKISLSAKDIEPFLLKGVKANVLVFVNGKFCKEHSTIISSASVLEIKPFSEGDPAVLEKYFNKNIATIDGFTHLNTAYAQDGAYIRIPKNKAVEEPVFLYFISDAKSGNVFSQPRNIIVAEENSEVKVVESYHSVGEHSGFNNVVTEIVLHTNANVDYYKLQNDSPLSYHVGTTQVHQEGKSTFSATTITLDGDIVRNNLNIVLNAEYCDAHMYGLTLLDANQHADNHTIADHAKPHCESNELYKSILNGKATGVFNGKIFVKPDAQKTNAFQSNKTILLSKDATMNTKPQLEIFADDVKCSHGATVGQLDEEPLFYLRARGISEDKAKALLVLAFAQDIIDHIKIEPLKERLIQVLNEKLGY